MEAASAPLEEEFQLRQSPKLDSSGFGEGARGVHRGPRGTQKPAAPRESRCTTRGPLAPDETPSSGSWSAGRPREVGAGLRNLGNTCYANAALQCLSYTPPLARYLLSGLHSVACGRQGASQEDATLIRGIFGGHWRSLVQCLRCQGVSDTLDPYLDVGLDIQAAQSVTQALDLLVRPEPLDGYQCGQCLRKVPANKTLRLHAASMVLRLVLKRFSALAEGKLERDVRYPEQLDLRPYLSRRRRAHPLLYRLYAVLVHSCRSCHGGHYFCNVRTAGGGWLRMEDDQVTACDASVAQSQPAYLLFYVHSSELEGDGGKPRCPGTEHKFQAAASTHRGPESAPNFTGPGSEEPVKHTNSEQRPWLQELSRPKPQFNLSELQCALPTEAVVLHQF